MVEADPGKEKYLTVEKFSLDQFNTLKELGSGTFGDVYLVSQQSTSKKFALKTLNKEHMIAKNRVQNVYQEKQALIEVGKHSNIVSLRGSFQDDENLYYLLDYCKRGSLGDMLK